MKDVLIKGSVDILTNKISVSKLGFDIIQSLKGKTPHHYLAELMIALYNVIKSEGKLEEQTHNRYFSVLKRVSAEEDLPIKVELSTNKKKHLLVNLKLTPNATMSVNVKTNLVIDFLGVAINELSQFLKVTSEQYNLLSKSIYDERKKGDERILNKLSRLFELDEKVIIKNMNIFQDFVEQKCKEKEITDGFSLFENFCIDNSLSIAERGALAVYYDGIIKLYEEG